MGQLSEPLPPEAQAVAFAQVRTLGAACACDDFGETETECAVLTAPRPRKPDAPMDAVRARLLPRPLNRCVLVAAR